MFPLLVNPDQAEGGGAPLALLSGQAAGSGALAVWRDPPAHSGRPSHLDIALGTLSPPAPGV